MLISRRFLAAVILFSGPAFAASVPGIENFDKVDSHVYRGAQPTGEGIRYLAQLGVKTVLDLREDGSRSRAEEKAVSEAGMKYVSVPMTGLTPPTEDQIQGVLSLLEDASTGPVFVHCKRGADRTGTVIAAYHIDHDHWDNAKALTDARAHHMSPFQKPRQRYIAGFTARQTVRATVEQAAMTADATRGNIGQTGAAAPAGIALAQ